MLFVVHDWGSLQTDTVAVLYMLETFDGNPFGVN